MQFAGMNLILHTIKMVLRNVLTEIGLGDDNDT